MSQQLPPPEAPPPRPPALPQPGGGSRGAALPQSAQLKAQLHADLTRAESPDNIGLQTLPRSPLAPGDPAALLAGLPPGLLQELAVRGMMIARATGADPGFVLGSLLAQAGLLPAVAPLAGMPPIPPPPPLLAPLPLPALLATALPSPVGLTPAGHAPPLPPAEAVHPKARSKCVSTRLRLCSVGLLIAGRA
jgi:hypothetical protein